MQQYIHLLASFSVSLIRWLQWEVAERWSRFTPRSSPSCVSCADFLIFSFALRLVKLPWNFSALNYCGQLSWTSRAIAISRWWTTASTMSHSRSIASLFRDVRLRIPAFCLLKIEPGLVFEEKKIKLGLVKFAQFIFAGQNNVTEEVFCPAEREHRPAMGFLHNNE